METTLNLQDLALFCACFGLKAEELTKVDDE